MPNAMATSTRERAAPKVRSNPDSYWTTLSFVGPCVTVFGSARFREGHPYYDLGREVGRSLSDLGFTVMTGGGPGLMEAANRGAKDAGGRSVSCNITLGAEEAPNRTKNRRTGLALSAQIW